MGEYGAVVGQSTGAVAGAGGGRSSGLVGDIMDMASGLLDGLTAVPLELMVVVVAVIVGGSFVLSLRSS